MRRGNYGYFLLVLLIFSLFFLSCSSQNKNQVLIWHWMTDRNQAFQKLAKEYEKETGVKVRFEIFFPPNVYAQKVQAAAQAGTLPDIFGILGEKEYLASFVRRNLVVDFSPYFEEKPAWKDSFISQALEVSSFSKDNIYRVKAGIYGIPIDFMNIQFLYNKELFKKAGLDPNHPPRNFAEFIAQAKLLHQKLGVEGFICGWGETWLMYSLALDFAFNIMGEKKVLDTFRGKYSYNSPGWVKVFSLFRQMKEAGIIPEGILTMANKEAEEIFANQRAAFSFNGSWCVNVYQKLNPQLNYAPCLVPKVSNAYPRKIWGGAGASFMVNAHSPRKEAAVKFLEWLTQKKQQDFLIRATNNLPAIKEAPDNLGLVLKEFRKGIDYVTHPNLWPVYEKPKVIEKFTQQLQKVILGEITPAEAAAAVEKVKLRIIKKD